MTTIWWGKPLSNGNAQKIYSFLKEHSDEYFSDVAIGESLGINPNSISAMLSTMRRTGWVFRHPNDASYAASQDDPVEDKTKIIAEYDRSKPKPKMPDGPMSPGELYLVRCLTIDQQGNPVIQIEESAIIYHGLRQL